MGRTAGSFLFSIEAVAKWISSVFCGKPNWFGWESFLLRTEVRIPQDLTVGKSFLKSFAESQIDFYRALWTAKLIWQNVFCCELKFAFRWELFIDFGIKRRWRLYGSFLWNSNCLFICGNGLKSMVTIMVEPLVLLFLLEVGRQKLIQKKRHSLEPFRCARHTSLPKRRSSKEDQSP